MIIEVCQDIFVFIKISLKVERDKSPINFYLTMII